VDDGSDVPDILYWVVSAFIAVPAHFSILGIFVKPPVSTEVPV
jgi:hypothetical protein